MISRCQGDDTFNQWLPFNQWEFPVSGETGNSLFSKDVYSFSIYLNPYPHTQPSLPFALATSSLDPIHGFND